MQKQFIGKICIIFCVLSFILSVCLNYKKFDVPYFQGIFMPVAVNIEIPQGFQKDFSVNSQNFDLPVIQADKVVISKVLYEPIKTINITSKSKDALRSVTSIDIFVGRDLYHFNKEDLKISASENSLNLKLSNFKGWLNIITVSFLAVFYNINFFVITWFFLISGILLLKDKFKITDNKILAIAFILAIICRLNMLTSYPLWWDEIYIAKPAINRDLPEGLRLFFSDPANPPLFYLITQAYMKIFHNSTEILRTIPFVFGVLGIWGIFTLAKKVSSINSAILATFISAISIYHICYAQEVRVYSFLLFLTPILTLSLFKLLENFNLKNSIYFTINTALVINAHLFGTLFMACNFVYGIVKLLKIKSLSKTLSFAACNFIAFLTLAPYLYFNITKSLTDKTLNPHIEPTSLKLICNIINNNFGSVSLVFILVLFSIAYLSLNNKNLLEKQFVKYGLFTFVGFYTLAIAFSFTRPLLMPRYFVIVYPLYISLFAILTCNLYKNTNKTIIKIFLILITIFMINSQSTNNAWKTKETYENLIAYTNSLSADKPTSPVNLFILPERFRLYYFINYDTELNTDLFKNRESYYITKYSAKFYLLKEFEKGQYQVINTSFRPCKILKMQN